MGPVLSTLSDWTPLLLLVAFGALGGIGYAASAVLKPPGTPPEPPAPGLATWGARALLGSIAALVIPLLPFEASTTVGELIAYAIIAGYGGPSLLATVWERFEGVVLQAKLGQAQQQLTEANTQLDEAHTAVNETLTALDEAQGAVAQAAAQVATPADEGGLEGVVAGPGPGAAVRGALDTANAQLAAARERLRAVR